MDRLNLHEFHQRLGAHFATVDGAEVVDDYGDILAEHAALTRTAGVLDLGFRSRLCLTGADRVRFLHGQVTNDVKKLTTGEGCYAAVVTAKGRMQSDLNIYALSQELLLDFEPGLGERIAERLNKYLVADDVQIVDVAPHYGLLSVQGPRAGEAIMHLAMFGELPKQNFAFRKTDHPTLGEVYLVNRQRCGANGFDLFVPTASIGTVAEKLAGSIKTIGGRYCGWKPLEIARIEAGIPRFGIDMDESNLPQECGIEDHAVSYTKGCYIGQEVLNRVHTMGHVNRVLRGFLLPQQLQALPGKGDKLVYEGKEAGFITSAAHSLRRGMNIAMGYVRRERAEPGTSLTLTNASGEHPVSVCGLPITVT